MYVSVAVVQSVLKELARERALDTAMLDAAVSRPELLTDAGGKIPVTHYARIVQAALDTSEDPALGLRTGWHATTSPEHILGFVLVNSDTLRDAVHLFHRYARLMFEDASWLIAESEDEARFGFKHPHVWGPVARFESELVLSFALSRFRLHFLGDDAPMREVRFQHEEPAWVESYQTLFGCPLQFGAPTNELVFDRAALDTPRLEMVPWRMPRRARGAQPVQATATAG